MLLNLGRKRAPAPGDLAGLLVVATTGGCATMFKGSSSTMVVTGLGPNDRVVTPEGVEVPRRGDELRLPANGDVRALVIKGPGGDRPLLPHRFAGGGWVFLDLLVFPALIVDGFTQSLVRVRRHRRQPARRRRPRAGARRPGRPGPGDAARSAGVRKGPRVRAPGGGGAERGAGAVPKDRQPQGGRVPRTGPGALTDAPPFRAETSPPASRAPPRPPPRATIARNAPPLADSATPAALHFTIMSLSPSLTVEAKADVPDHAEGAPPNRHAPWLDVRDERGPARSTRRASIFDESRQTVDKNGYFAQRASPYPFTALPS